MSRVTSVGCDYVMFSDKAADIIDSLEMLFFDDLDFTGENGLDFTWGEAIEDGYDRSCDWFCKEIEKILDVRDVYHDRVGWENIVRAVKWAIETYFEHNESYYPFYDYKIIYGEMFEMFPVGVTISYATYE